MQLQRLSSENLLKNIQANDLVLTANSRLRRMLMQTLSEQKSAGVFASPKIFSFMQWAQESWLQLQDQAYPNSNCIVINQSQRLKLWRDILSDNENTRSIINPEKLAQHADTAYQTLEQWLQPLSSLDDYDHPDSKAFKTWAESFIQQCESLNFISQSQMFTHLKESIEAPRGLVQVSRIFLVEFDDIPPSTLALLQRAGKELIQVQLDHEHNSQVVRIECDDIADEYLCCANWAKNLLENNQPIVIKGKPQLRIGIIDPSLGQNRDKLERVLCETFEPQFLMPGVKRYTLPFNFSAGIPLAQCPLVKTALQLLSFNYSVIELEKCCQLLHSPFWHTNEILNNETSLADRSQTEYNIRAMRQAELRLAQLRQCSQASITKISKSLEEQISEADKVDIQNPLDSYTNLSQRLQNFSDLRRKQGQKSSSKNWSQLFADQLQVLGWPGERRLDSNEFQQYTQFQQLLDELSALDNCQALLTLSDAIKEMFNLCRGHHYQAKTPDSPIQVLGALEGAGMSFDYCWVLGMQQKNWPPSPQPNPLLPYELQRSLQMPHATVERELKFAQALTQGYRQCAKEVMFSYARQQGDEALLASTLIADIPNSESPLTTNSHGPGGTDEQHGSDISLQQYKQQLFHRRSLEWNQSQQGPALQPREYTMGGSAVLKQQALCPFNAFAVHRLGAKPFETPKIGLSPLERGNILHLALELIWEELGSQAALLAMSVDDTDKFIKSHLQTAIDKTLSQRFDLGPRFREIEHQRLQQQLQQWMEIESQRPPFEVLGVEVSRNLQLGKLNLSLRLDRLDKILVDPESPPEDSNLTTQEFIIDYKSGNSNIKNWIGERLEEPQLPLYTMTDESIDSIAFAQINTNAITFTGLAQSISPAPGVISWLDEKSRAKITPQQSWEEQKKVWRCDLELLAKNYTDGMAELNFKNPIAQRYSTDLASLQRTAELSEKQQFWQAQPPATANNEFDF